MERDEERAATMMTFASGGTGGGRGREGRYDGDDEDRYEQRKRKKKKMTMSRGEADTKSPNGGDQNAGGRLSRKEAVPYIKRWYAALAIPTCCSPTPRRQRVQKSSSSHAHKIVHRRGTCAAPSGYAHHRITRDDGG
jgi:hypothetical protein